MLGIYASLVFLKAPGMKDARFRAGGPRCNGGASVSIRFRVLLLAVTAKLFLEVAGQRVVAHSVFVVRRKCKQQKFHRLYGL